MKTIRSLAVSTVAGGVMLCLMLAAGSSSWGQQQGQSARSTAQAQAQAQAAAAAQANVPMVNGNDGASDGMGSIEEQQAKLRNAERQKQLVEDTQRLLSLANELKLDVDKSSKDTLSLDVVRKADEIEKLAHNVKEKMKGS